jgi:7-cyano-7-deazaguanine synthase
MCFIVGGIDISKEDIESILPKMSIRGRDGYGYFLSSRDKKIMILKSEKNPETIKNPLPVQPFVFLANSRATPTTEYETGAGFSIENQQPFTDNKKRFYVVHNGIIANDKELVKKYNLKVSCKVDSAILPYLFDKVGVVEGLKELKGSYAILCYDTQEQIFYAAKNFMPLVFFITEKGFGFSSMFEGIRDIECERAVEVNPYICLKIDMTKEEIEAFSLYPREQNKKVLVICSSGADSATTAYVYKHLGYEVGLIHFKYGQAAEAAEELCVKRLAKKLNAKLFVYDAKSIFGIFKQNSLLLSQKTPDKKKQMLDAESTLSYVPNRNAIMAMVSAGVAEINKYDTIAMGLQQMDSVYPDNNPGMVDKVDNLLKYSLNWGTNIHFAAPCVHLIKHEIFSLGKKLGIDFINDSTSCYYPKIKDGKVVSCNSCGCCQFKNTALKMIKEKDFIGDVDTFINKYVKPFV